MAPRFRSPLGARLTTLAADAGDEVELVVDGIATGGDGVGRDPGGRVVFVPRTAPGDRVRVRLETVRPRWARGSVVELLAPGPDRRPAPCPAYDRCGGCDLQHLPSAVQREARRGIVRDTLRRIGGAELDVPPVVPAPEELGYRNRVRFTLRRDAAGTRAGFREIGRPDAIADLEDCPLAEQPIRRAWRALRAAWGEGARALPAGEELELTLRSSAAGALALHVCGGDPESPGSPSALAAAVPGLASYTWEDAGGGHRLLAGVPELEDVWQGIRFRLGPEAFLQANREVSARIDAFLEELVGDLRGRRVADLYAGVGARSIRWAAAGAVVTAVESNPAACAAGRRAAEEAGAEVRFVEGRVERHPLIAREADVVVVNPPRTGLASVAASALAGEGRARRLVYVSCDPATLARDLTRLAPRWSPAELLGFDAFPQTGHVETVVGFAPRADANAAEKAG
jgi:23S rRNA (uracil1939-C5)-methyltransferase